MIDVLLGLLPDLFRAAMIGMTELLFGFWVPGGAHA